MLTVIGSGTCAPTKERSCSSYFVQAAGKLLLFDIGFGSIRRLVEGDIDFHNIDYFICSHTHPDHVSDLAPFLMALLYTPGLKRRKRLSMIGPVGLRNFMENLSVMYANWIVNPMDYDLEIIELQNNSYSSDGFEISAMSMDHSKNANGYRLHTENKVLSYTGDTGFCDNLIRLLHKADLAIVECSFPDEEAVQGHLTPTLAASAASQAECKRLLLTHFYPMMDEIDIKAIASKNFSGRIEIAQDLQAYLI